MSSERTNALPVFDSPAGGALSEAMQSAFADCGVLILRDFVSMEACNALKTRAQELVAAFDPERDASVFSTTDPEQLDDRYFIDSGDKIRFFLESDALDAAGKLRAAKHECLNKMGHALHDLDPAFDAFSRSPSLGEIARRLGQDDPAIIQSMYIFKPPRIGGEVVCHQDSTYLYTEPESCLGFWFALEDATTGNGCMHFIPGAHRGPLRQRNFRVDHSHLRTDILDATPWPKDDALAAEASAGTLVVFNGKTPHFSAANRSGRSRHAYTLHAIDRRCHYPADNWLQRSAHLPLRGFN